MVLTSLQVLVLRLLRAILPSWDRHLNSQSQQQEVVQRLFLLLGQVLVLCNSPFSESGSIEKRRKKKKLHASLTASTSSTVAEEIVVLLRRLHPLPVWNELINNFIGAQLQQVPDLIVMTEKNGAFKTKPLTKEKQVCTFCLCEFFFD